MKRIFLTTLIVSVPLLILFSLIHAVKNNCGMCGQFYLVRNSFAVIWGTFCTTLIFSILSRWIKFKDLWLKMIVNILSLGLITQAIIWAWAASEVVIYYGGFSNLSIQTVKNDIAQELGGLTFWALIISFCVPLANELLNRQGIKTASSKK